MKFSNVKNSLNFVAKKARKYLTKRRLIILVIVIVLFSLFLFFQKRNSLSNIETTLISEGNLRQTITASARVEAEKKAILSFPTSGKVFWIGVTEGQMVKSGQRVATLDKSELELQLKKLLNNFEREFTKFDDSNDAVTDEVLNEEIRRIKKRAQIDLNQTVLDVEIHNSAIKLSNLYSPIDGIVTEVVPLVAGVNITPGSSRFTIVDPKSVYIRADVNEVDITKIKLNQKVLIKLDSYPDEEIESTVKSIGFESVQTSTGGTAFSVKIFLPQNLDLKYKLGMKADVEFVLNEEENILLVDSTAIVSEQGKNFVWIIENRKTKKIEVDTGISSIDKTQIITGVTKDQKIIRSPKVGLKEGQIVRQ